MSLNKHLEYIKPVLLKYIAKTNALEQDNRVKIYRVAFISLQRLPVSNQDEIRPALEQALKEIEISFPPEHDSQLPPGENSDQDNQPQDFNTGDRSENLESPSEELLSLKNASGTDGFGDANIQPSKKPSVLMRLFWILTPICILAGVYFIVMETNLLSVGGSGGSNGNVAVSQTEAELSSNRDAPTNSTKLVDLNFAEGQDSIDIYNFPSNVQLPALPTENGYPVLSGKLNIFYKKTIKIETGKTYLAKLVVRVPKGWDSSVLQPYLHAGSWNLKSIDQPLEKVPLSLFAVNERIPSTSQVTSEGLISFSGTITTSDAQTDSQFPKSARYFKPFIGFNSEGSDIEPLLVSYEIYMMNTN